MSTHLDTASGNARGINLPLRATRAPWNLLSLSASFDEAQARAAVTLYARKVIEDEAPYLPTEHLRVFFAMAPFGGALLNLEVGIFGNVDIAFLAASLPEFRVIKNVSIEAMICQQSGTTAAIDVFSPSLSDDRPAFQPILSIFVDEMDLRMKGVKDPESFLTELHSSINDDYRKVVGKIQKYAQNMLLPNEF